MSARAASPPGVLGEVVSILRVHIILVAVTAALTFGWLMNGVLAVGVALLGGVDWMLINLLNRITDLKEDLANDIPGTARIARARQAFIAAWIALFVGSFAASLWLYPELTWLRGVVQLIGLGYSVAMVPTPSGLKRFKDLYFFKNFMSSVLFVLTLFVYNLAVVDWQITTLPAGLRSVVVLALFFVLFELTYEIMYDMRDLEGDRLAGVPTYPVVHGLTRARQIIDGLLLAAFTTLAAGLGLGWVGLREGLMLAAPAVQLAFYRPRYARGLTTRDCITLTHLGSALLILYLIGNLIWLKAGLPANILLRQP